MIIDQEGKRVFEGLTINFLLGLCTARINELFDQGQSSPEIYSVSETKYSTNVITNIRNGIIDKDFPAYLSPALAQDLATALGITTKELLWGSDEEQIAFRKPLFHCIIKDLYNSQGVLHKTIHKVLLNFDDYKLFFEKYIKQSYYNSPTHLYREWFSQDLDRIDLERALMNIIDKCSEHLYGICHKEFNSSYDCFTESNKHSITGLNNKIIAWFKSDIKHLLLNINPHEMHQFY